MTLVDLTFLILGLNHLVDYGYHEGVTIKDVEDHVESGDVLDWLDKKFEGHIDLSIYRGRPVAKEITKELQTSSAATPAKNAANGALRTMAFTC
jgi:hypothetical protein